MRFERQPRDEEFEWTPRKQAAFLRRRDRQVERVERDHPLFAREFAPPPSLSLDEEKARRQEMRAIGEQHMCDLMSKHWRQGRQAYFACAPAVQAQIAAEWRRWPGPAKAGYFNYVVEKHNGAAEGRARAYAVHTAEIRARVLAGMLSQQHLTLG